MPPDPNITKLIDNVCNGSGTINCCALRKLLLQMVATMEPAKQSGPPRGNLRCSSAGASGSNYRVMIDGRGLNKPSSSFCGGSAPQRKREPPACQGQKDREHEVILCKLEIVQRMMKDLQKKLDRLEKASSNTDINGECGSRTKNIRKHYCGVGAPPEQ